MTKEQHTPNQQARVHGFSWYNCVKLREEES